MRLRRRIVSGVACALVALATAGVSEAQPGAPAAPANLTSVVNGLNVSLSWAASPGATSYVVEAGSSPGLSNLFVGDVGNVTTLATNAPAGTYFVRVRARDAAGTGAPSNEATVVLGATGGCTTAPNSATGLTGAASGSNVQLQWNAPAAGCAPTTFIVQAGSATGLSDIAVAPIAALSLTATAPTGVYFIRVVAVNPFGASAPTNEIQLFVGDFSEVAGRFRGDVVEPGFGTYPLEIVLNGPTGGTVTYGPPVGCAGTMTGLDIVAGVYRFRETVSKPCATGATVRIRAVAGGISWEWTPPNGTAPFLNATLTRVP